MTDIANVGVIGAGTMGNGIAQTCALAGFALAAATSRPAQFLGMHFFNPVPLRALVGLIRGLQTSDETPISTIRNIGPRRC